MAALADPSLDPLFWRAERLGAESAWWDHVPFAHWIVCATSPRVLVELGAHTGVSYTAFCQAVAHAGLDTRCHAVDTWRGDPQAGLYGPEVLEDLRGFHDERFGAFSTLLQCTFDEALDQIEDGSIDLLHIDGLHTYAAVRHDFESWLPKLSNRAVVLFHDINVRRDDFGVWRLWAELRERYSAFEFVHGYGLGVLAVGTNIPAPVGALCALTDPAAIAMIRTRYARLGERWRVDTERRLLWERTVAAETQANQLRAERARQNAEADHVQAEFGRRGAEVEQLRVELGQRGAEVEQLRVELGQRGAEVEQLRVELGQRGAEADQHEARLVEETNRRVDAEQRAAQALRLLAEEGRRRSEAAHRAAEAEARFADEALLRAEIDKDAVSKHRVLQEQLTAAERQLTAYEVELADVVAQTAQVDAERDLLRHELDDLRRSTFWRLTNPARRIATVLPPSVRRQARRGARVAYWLITPNRTSERIAFFRARRQARRAPLTATVDPRPAEQLPPINASAETTAAEISDKPTGAESSLLERFFDADWYNERYGDTSATGLTPFEHFLIYGTQELRDPNPAFDTAWYCEAYADVKHEYVKREYIAFEQFVSRGAQQGRRPFRDFDFDFYREQAGLQSISNLEAYEHYLKQGRASGIPTSQGHIPVKLRSGAELENLPSLPPGRLLGELLAASSATVMRGHPDGRRPRTLDLDQYRMDITLNMAPVSAPERSIGIFVHLCGKGSAEEVAGYLACIDLPKRINVSTGSGGKSECIYRIFKQFGLTSASEFSVVPNCANDIAPLLIEFGDRLAQHDVFLKIHDNSYETHPENGKRWRKYLYNELIGDSERVQAIVSQLRADSALGLLMAKHYYGVSASVGVGPNYEVMRRILSKLNIDLIPNQKIEYPSGSMFWCRGDALTQLAHLGFDWSDFDLDSSGKNGTLAQGIERSYLFFCASADKKWGFLPPRHLSGPKISRQEVTRLIRASGSFDEVHYKTAYPDVANIGADPIKHWVDIGCLEGRLPFDPRFPNSVVFDLLECHFWGLPSSSYSERAETGKRGIWSPGIWGAAADAEIRCLKSPYFADEVAIFATYSPDNWLKPHVLYYVESLRHEGISVILVVNTENILRLNNTNLLSHVDGLYIRQAKGYDFAAWAHVLQLERRVLDEASLVYLINDSLIGPVNQAEFADVLQKIRDCKADVIAITESLDRGWHFQSYFLALRRRAVLSDAFGKFMEEVTCLEDKEEVIRSYELRMATVLKSAGLDCAAIFPAIGAGNPTAHRWRELLESGFPFVKAYIFQNSLPDLDSSDCLSLLSARGFDVRRAGGAHRGRCDIWGRAADVEIRCLKMEVSNGEVALFATHSSDGLLKPHVLHYIASLRHEGIAVVLIVNADQALLVSEADILQQTDGLFIRQSKGYDFAAWAHVLQLQQGLSDAAILYLVNDSLIGPINQEEFTNIVHRIRDSEADMIGLTESIESGWHLQSYFLALKKRVLLSCIFWSFVEDIVCYKSKEDVINHYERGLSSTLTRTGLRCEPLFCAIDALNPTIHHWRELLDFGFPFVKSIVVRNAVPGLDTSACLALLSARGLGALTAGEKAHRRDVATSHLHLTASAVGAAAIETAERAIAN